MFPAHLLHMVPKYPGMRKNHDLVEKGLIKYDYFLIIARMEPENNIEMVLDGFSASNSDKKMIISRESQQINSAYIFKTNFAKITRIIFLGAIYDKAKLHSLKAFSSLVFSRS